MAKPKSPRLNNSPEKQVITMPEAGPVPVKRNPTTVNSVAGSFSASDLEGKIRQRAYELYVERGYAAGFDQEDWFKAEHEILSRGKRQQSA